MPDERTTLALRALALRALADRVKAASDEVRAQIVAAWPQKDRAVVWLGDDGQTEAGQVRHDLGFVTASVGDMGALIDWCEQHHPTEVEEWQPAPVTRVRPRFLEKLLADAKAAGAAVDTSTGEVVPGLSVTTGPSKVAVVPARTDDGRAALDDAIRSGVALPELMPGGAR